MVVVSAGLGDGAAVGLLVSAEAYDLAVTETQESLRRAMSDDSGAALCAHGDRLAFGSYFVYIIIGAEEQQQHGCDTDQPVVVHQRQSAVRGQGALLLPGFRLFDALLHQGLGFPAVYALQRYDVLIERGGAAQLLQ